MAEKKKTVSGSSQTSKDTLFAEFESLLSQFLIVGIAQKEGMFCFPAGMGFSISLMIAAEG